jgi:hypothetical protein
MRAWGPESRILAIDRGRARASIGISCQPIAGYEREMFSAGCTMNIGSKKLLRESDRLSAEHSRSQPEGSCPRLLDVDSLL